MGTMGHNWVAPYLTRPTSVPYSGAMSAVARAREASGLSQERLAKLAGVSRKTIARVENDVTYATSVDVARRIARTLGQSIDELFGHGSEGTACGDCRGKNTGPRTAAVEGSAGPDSHTGV